MHRWLALFLLLLCACEKSPTTFSGKAMEIGYKVIVASPKKSEVEEIIQDVFAEVDSHLNNWNPDSEISQLNRLSAGEKVALSSILERVLLQADQLVHLTEGKFDPTVEPLQQIWKNHLRRDHVPPEELLSPLLPAIGWENVHIEKGFFWKDHPLTALDLGGIAKGYCVDLLSERLTQLGFVNHLVEWGGEIRTSGRHPNGRKWNVAIAGITTIEMEENAIATSGDYFQSWSVGGITYTHIINPLTKRPLEVRENSIASATILAPSCTLADGLATAMMLFDSPEESAEFAANLKNVKCWVAQR